MTLLDRYVGTEILKALLLVLLAIVPLFDFLDLIQELDEVGTGRYGIGDVLLYELRMTPRRTLDLLPFGALVGTTVGLALLAQHSELIAAQAAGVSVSRIAWSVLKVGIVIVALAAVLDEYVVSPLHHSATQAREIALSDTQVLPSNEGFWIRSENVFVNIGRIENGRVPRDIDILEMDEDRRAKLFIHAAEADIADPSRWLLRDAFVKRFDGTKISNEQVPEMVWRSHLTTAQVRLLHIEPIAMSPSQLYSYVDYLRHSGQSPERYETVFWGRIALPLATCAMMLLAVRFAFGNNRSQTVAKRIVLAVGAGILFQIAHQIATNAGQVFNINPVLTSILVPLAAMILALALLKSLRN